MPHIVLHPEYIGALFNINITNTFLTSVLVSSFLTTLAIIFYSQRNNRHNFLVDVFRVFIYDVLKITDMVTADRKISLEIFPIIATFFLFIVTANLLALLPGFLGSFYIRSAGEKISLLRSPNSDLTTTLALAIVSVVTTQFFSAKTLGVKGYIKRFLNLESPIRFILGFFEILSEGVKILSFSFRLFGNIFAGEVLLLIVGFLLPFIIPVPFMFLEIFVGVIQAFIFSMLTMTFMRVSITSYDESKKKEVGNK